MKYLSGLLPTPPIRIPPAPIATSSASSRAPAPPPMSVHSLLPPHPPPLPPRPGHGLLFPGPLLVPIASADSRSLLTSRSHPMFTPSRDLNILTSTNGAASPRQIHPLRTSSSSHAKPSPGPLPSMLIATRPPRSSPVTFNDRNRD